jgi:hypothetical protein
MKLYKSPINAIWAYESDGSQDNLIPNNFVAITEEEANIIRKDEQEKLQQEWLLKQPSKEQQIEQLQAQLNALKA